MNDNEWPKIKNWLNPSNSSNMPKTSVNQPHTIGSSATTTGGYTKMNGGGTVVLKPTTKGRTATVTSADNTNRDSVLNSISDATAGGNLRNVVGLHDLNSSGKNFSKIKCTLKLNCSLFIET